MHKLLLLSLSLTCIAVLAAPAWAGISTSPSTLPGIGTSPSEQYAYQNGYGCSAVPVASGSLGAGATLTGLLAAASLIARRRR